jgi:Na+/phosphate symporter
MNEKEYLHAVEINLASLRSTMDDLKKCLFSRDKKRVKETVKAFYASLNTTLPLFTELIGKPEKNAAERKLLCLLPALQQLGSASEDLVCGVQAAVEAEISLTDKALTEISEIMGLVRDLTRDTHDAMSSGNEHFKEYVLGEGRVICDRIREFGIDHQQRLVIGVCMPKASFLYLDIMNSLKRITQEISSLFEGP